MIIFNKLQELVERIGQDIGVGEWLDVTQDQIQRFANATGDFQWIHVDTERATIESPYGRTIAHGFYILSVLPLLRQSVYRVNNIKMGVNYGLNKVRFMNAVRVDDRIRLHARLINVEERDNGGYMVEIENTIEIEGVGKPACVAQTLGLYYQDQLAV